MDNNRQVEEAVQVLLKERNEEFSLRGSIPRLTIDDIRRIAYAFQRNRNLVEINLEENHIDPNGAEILSAAFKLNKNLSSLSLRDNSFGSKGMKLLLEAIEANGSLGELDLGKNQINTGSKFIGDMLGGNHSLVVLDLSSNDFGKYGAKNLGEALKKNKCLTKLDIGWNGIYDAGASYIAEALKVNTSLVHLAMRKNKIKAPGIEKLALALEQNDTLEVLDIGGNKCKGEAAIALGGALKVNRRLFKLNLRGTSIGDEELKSITSALSSNQTLVYLLLGNNRITSKGEEFLRKAIESNESIGEVDLKFSDPEACEDVLSKLKSNNERKLRDFQTALAGNEKAPWNRSRLMFVGQGRAGKTSTVRSLLGKAFTPIWDSTIGADVSEGTASKTNWKQTRRNVNFTSKFAARIMLKLPNHESRTAESVNDLVEPNGVSSLDESDAIKPVSPIPQTTEWAPEANETVESQREADNMDDLMSKIMSNEFVNELLNSDSFADAEEEKDVVKEFDESLIVDAKRDADSFTLSLWDFGGQEVFYAMHHIFLTKSGVYVLVFDMRDLKDPSKEEDAINYMSFWMRSIRLHAPLAPLLLIGTFSANVQKQKDLQYIDDTLKTLAANSSSQVVSNIEDGLIFFPIDNKEWIGIRQLRLAIDNVVRKDDASSQEISIRWMSLLDKILSQKRKRKSFLPLKSVKAMALQVGIQSAWEQEEALHLFHERGMLIHLTATEVLKNIVVIKPQWLVDALSKVIRDARIHRFDSTEFKSVGLEEDLKLTFTMALASRDFLEYVWNNSQVDFFIDLMKRTMLLSEWSFKKEKHYLIPSLLIDSYNRSVFGIRCVFNFSMSFLPNGIFQRLICLCVAYCGKYTGSEEVLIKEPELYKNFASIEFEPGLLFHLHEDKDSETITVHVDEPKHATKSFLVIQSMLRKINADVMGVGLKWKISFENERTGELVDYEQAREEDILPWFGNDMDSEILNIPIEKLDLASFLEML